MTGFGNNIKSEKKIIKDAKTNNLKAHIIDKAFLLHSKGNICGDYSNLRFFCLYDF